MQTDPGEATGLSNSTTTLFGLSGRTLSSPGSQATARHLGDDPQLEHVVDGDHRHFRREGTLVPGRDSLTRRSSRNCPVSFGTYMPRSVSATAASAWRCLLMDRRERSPEPKPVSPIPLPRQAGGGHYHMNSPVCRITRARESGRTGRVTPTPIRESQAPNARRPRTRCVSAISGPSGLCARQDSNLQPLDP